MPFYDYECPACGSFSELRPISAASDTSPCPVCGEAAARQVSAPALLRGAGPRAVRAPPRAHRAGCGCCAPASFKAESVVKPVSPPRFLS